MGDKLKVALLNNMKKLMKKSYVAFVTFKKKIQYLYHVAINHAKNAFKYTHKTGNFSF